MSLIDTFLGTANQVVLGKRRQIELALTSLLAGGDLLIEDLPGVGKTTLAHLFAKLLGLRFQRIQFTSDMLPADILGASVYDKNSGGFSFHPGPIFAQVVLADEVNRATPKAQSALLEAMEERQVTVDGETRPLPRPYFVIATQNPDTQIGTFPLPESQLDRFLMCLQMGYPDPAAERELLKGEDRRDLLARLEPVMDGEKLQSLQDQVKTVHAADAVVDYVQHLLLHTREDPRLHLGLSPRAGLALLRAAQAWALIHQRHHVLPEDVQAVFPSVARHRISRRDESSPEVDLLLRQMLEEVAIP